MELVGLLPRLQQLDLICYTDLTDELLLGLTALPALRHLRLTMCETLSETALRALMGPQSAIESLLLDGMCLSAEHLAALANSPRLRRLGLKGCQPLGREALRHCRPLPALTELVLASNDWVDAEVVDTLAEQYPGLEHLNLSGCLHVNDQALQATQGLPRLRNLWVSGLNLVTPQAVVGLAGASPALTEVMVPRSFRLPADAPTPLLNASGQPVALITKALPG